MNAHFLRHGTKSHHIRVLFEASASGIEIHNHTNFTISHKERLEQFRKLGVAKGYDALTAFPLRIMKPRAGGQSVWDGWTDAGSSLVFAHGFQTLSEAHEALVDAPSFL